MTRPLSLSLASAVLVTLSVVVPLGGLALTWVSGCCGAREPVDASPVVGSLLAGAVLLLSAVLVARGSGGRVVVAALTASVLLAGLAASRHAVDLQVLVVAATPCWLALCVLLSRPAAATWFAEAEAEAVG